MKKLFYIFLSATVLLFGYGCSDQLETAPTQSVGSDEVYSSASNALSVMNGIYRAMYTSGWGSAWNDENCGLMAYMLAQDLPGEDHIQNASGSGWFYYDYTYGIASDWSSSAGRQYQCWNFFYTLISNTNAVIAHESNFQDDPDLANYVMGQAYAMRAFCYLWLIQNFQQNGDTSLPGVPVYTEPTSIDSKGKGRGTVADVYDRINKDLDLAISKFESSSVTQKHASHIDKYVAYGIKARAMMVEHNYPEAYKAALKAMEAPKQVAPFSEITTVNDVSKSDIMWGFAVQSDQSNGVHNVYNHIDADAGTTYSKGAQHLISAWLYAQIPDTDARKAWWRAPMPQSEWVNGTSKKSYVQLKLVYKDPTLGTGDIILMRYEEMCLIAAEAACHENDYDNARLYLKELLKKRDTNYEAAIASYSDGNTINNETSTTINNLMDFILLQRRIELWGEAPRMHDIKRLGLGVNRNFADDELNNHVYVKSWAPRHKHFIYAIPQKEFEGNSALNLETDQNPL